MAIRFPSDLIKGTDPIMTVRNAPYDVAASAERVEDAQKAWLRNARCEMKIPKGRACAFPQRLQDLQSSFQALDGFFLWHQSGPIGAS
jgi:hypothetical protein